MVEEHLRQKILPNVTSLVVKVGTQLLTNVKGEFDGHLMEQLSADIAYLMKKGIEVTLVSSGSVGVGRDELGLDARPTDIGMLQAVAAVGQCGLINQWRHYFARHNLKVAQMLLNRDDFDQRNRYLNIRNCIGALHELNAVPIVNENDTVSVDEIRFGDNDVLAAQVTNALCAEVLVMLTVVDGLMDEKGVVQDVVDDVVVARNMVSTERSHLGSGGMFTKLEAARMVTDAGEVGVIANGREPNVLRKILAGESAGTVFVPATRKLLSRERWISLTKRPAGVIIIDDGAAEALKRNGSSLLATGIVEVTGRFEKGDLVVIRDNRGREIARGLINYDGVESRKIMGRQSDDFNNILDRPSYKEVIHRDNLVLTRTES